MATSSKNTTCFRIKPDVGTLGKLLTCVRALGPPAFHVQQPVANLCGCRAAMTPNEGRLPSDDIVQAPGTEHVVGGCEYAQHARPVRH